MNNIIEQFCELRDKIIEKRYEKLDKNQVEAVLNKHKNCIVIACPGAGKTQVIINRVDYLCSFGEVYKTKLVPKEVTEEQLQELRQYLTTSSNKIPNILKSFAVKSENIVVITFTRAAAISMKQRYKNLFKTNKEPFFGTFHGLFYRILRRYRTSINIIEGNESYRIIKHVLQKYMDEVSDDKLKEVIGDISKLKTSRKTMLEFNPTIEKDIFRECYESYEGYKEERGLIDFDDIQLQCLELFKQNERLRVGYRNLFKYMLVDEFQDSDMLQLELLALLNENNSIYAVGDEDQCIYGFRGSRPECMVYFNKIFEAGEKIYLNKNYRSKSNIVDISKNLINNNSMRNEKQIISSKEAEGTITVLNKANEGMEAEEIYQNIIKLQGINSERYSDFAILYRTNIESRSLIDTFIRKGVPFRLLDKEYNFFEHFICKDILAYLRLSIDGTNKESFFRIINKPFRYISKLSLEKVKAYNVRENLFEVLKNLEDIPIFQMKTVDKLKNSVQGLNKLSLVGAIETVIHELGYEEYIVNYGAKFKTDVNELREIIEEFKKSAEEYKTIITFLAHVEEVTEKLKNNKKDVNKDAVILSTIHGVKGMEFKNVFIINCMEENIPHKNSIEKNIEEERRLFYVGITRAINNLWLCMSKDIRGNVKEPSRFIKECGLKFNSSYTGSFKVGDNVKHMSFGEGKITKLTDSLVEIAFNGGINRKFDPVILVNNRLVEKLEG